MFNMSETINRKSFFYLTKYCRRIIGLSLSNGYVILNVDNKYKIRAHRWIYEEYNKCCLLPWADVHHINGITTDNDPKNLMGLMKSQHGKLYMR